MSNSAAIGDLASAAAAADAAPDTRKVVSDALEESGRLAEAKLLRGDQPVELTAAGKVVLASVAEAARARKREPRPGPALRLTSHEKRRQVGEVIRRKDGMYVVTESSALSRVTEDYIEDLDAWAEYPQGPGRYSSYTAVPVEETEAERLKREAAEAKAAAEAAEAEAKKNAATDAWAPFAALPQAYQLPAGCPAPAWVDLDTHGPDKWGRRGTVRSIGTLPDGTRVGRVSVEVYDDSRLWYHVPQEVIDRFAGRTASARRLEALEVAHRIPSCRGEQTAEQVAAEWDALAAEHLAAYGDLPGGLSPAMRAREQGCVDAHPESWTEAVETLAGRDKEGVALRNDCATLGGVERLDAYRDWVATEGARIAADRQAAYDAAAAEWLPKLEAEFGAELAAELAAGVKKDHDTYAHIGEPDFEGAAEAARKEAAGLAAKEKAKAARKADPMVTVVGNTYPHRDALGLIPGAKLSKLKGGWTWKVPRSQAARLPRGLSCEE